MAIVDYRLNPFANVMDSKRIIDETHTVPSVSPFIIRLKEVPLKTDPSSLIVKFTNNRVLTEVAALPGEGEYWPDYNTTAHGVPNWNTGTLLFNSRDAGKTVKVTYNGIGTLVDSRLENMLEITFQGSKVNRSSTSFAIKTSSSSGRKNSRTPVATTNTIQISKVPNFNSGVYTLKDVIQTLIDKSLDITFSSNTSYTNCNCDCSDDSR